MHTHSTHNHTKHMIIQTCMYAYTQHAQPHKTHNYPNFYACTHIARTTTKNTRLSKLVCMHTHSTHNHTKHTIIQTCMYAHSTHNHTKHMIIQTFMYAYTQHAQPHKTHDYPNLYACIHTARTTTQNT